MIIFLFKNYTWFQQFYISVESFNPNLGGPFSRYQVGGGGGGAGKITPTPC